MIDISNFTASDRLNQIPWLFCSTAKSPNIFIYSVLLSVSCPKALYHLESDNLFRITVVVADWLG